MGPKVLRPCDDMVVELTVQASNKSDREWFLKEKDVPIPQAPSNDHVISLMQQAARYELRFMISEDGLRFTLSTVFYSVRFARFHLLQRQAQRTSAARALGRYVEL